MTCRSYHKIIAIIIIPAYISYILPLIFIRQPCKYI